MFDVEHLKKTYFKMATPVVIGLMITLIYNLVDTWFVARTGNVSLIAGVSICAPVFTALMAIGNIFGQGGSSLISRLLGKNDEASVKRISSACFYMALATGIIATVAMLTYMDKIILFMGANSDSYAYAREYYQVMAYGAPLVVLAFVHSNLVRCEGMSVQSMVGNLIGTILNIILDPIFIFTLNMGAKGAALATITGYLVSDIFFIILVCVKSKSLNVNPKKCDISIKEFAEIFGIGFTAAVTNIMSSLCVIYINRKLSIYGDMHVASMGMVLRVNMIAQLVLTGFAFGGVPVYGFLYGANNKKKLNELIRFIIMFLGSISVAITAVLVLGAGPIMRLFTDSPEMNALCASMLRWQAISAVFVSVVLVTTVLFQATGKFWQALIMSVSRQGVVFILVLKVFTRLFEYKGIIRAQAAADVISAVIGIALYALTFGAIKFASKKNAPAINNEADAKGGSDDKE